MRVSTIVKRCDKVRLLLDRFSCFYIENCSQFYGCPIVTFRYDLNQKFIGESEIGDFVAAKKILGAFYFVVDYKSSVIKFYYE